MARTTSRWREISRDVIARTLAALPATATIQDKRAALRLAYPFSQRANHPYRMWLIECRIALGIEKSKAAPTEPTSRLQHWKDGPWLTVHCGMCDGDIVGGCLLCCSLVRKQDAVVRSPEWRAFRAAAREGDAAAVLSIASDWLKEIGFEPLEVIP